MVVKPDIFNDYNIDVLLFNVVIPDISNDDMSCSIITCSLLQHEDLSALFPSLYIHIIIVLSIDLNTAEI